MYLFSYKFGNSAAQVNYTCISSVLFKSAYSDVMFEIKN